MKKKVDQFFIENFRSWSGRNYFDLNNINFLFGSNSSGKSSVIYALSLLRQSMSNDRYRKSFNSIDFLRPIGEFTDLGPIKNQAFSFVKNEELSSSDYMSFGYRFKDIDRFLNLLVRTRLRSGLERPNHIKILKDYKNLDLFKNTKEITLNYTFSSVDGKLMSIRFSIDNNKIIEFSSYNNQVRIDVPKDDDFWRKNLNINQITENGIEKELLNLDTMSPRFSDRKKASLRSQNIQETLKLKVEIETKQNEAKLLFEETQQAYETQIEAQKILRIIKNKSKYRFEKHKDSIFKKIHNKIFPNVIIDLFNEDYIHKQFDKHREEINDAYKDIKSWYNFEKEIRNIVFLVQEIIEQFYTLKKINESLYDSFGSLGISITSELDIDHFKFTDKILHILSSVKIIKNLDVLSSPLQNFEFPFYEMTYLFYFLSQYSDNEKAVSEITHKFSAELARKTQAKSIYEEQLNFYNDKLKELEQERIDYQKEVEESTIPFAEFMNLIVKKDYLTIDFDEDFFSLSSVLNKLSGQIYLYRDRQNNKNESEKIINIINNNSILGRSSIFAIFKEMQTMFFSNFRNLRVIGPHRRRPNRIELINPFEVNNNVGVEGQNILNVLKNADQKDLKELNKRLMELDISYSVSTEFREDDNSIKVLVKDSNDLIVSLTDVGYGVGQILPIVLECVLSKNKLLTIEQPELHLHPKLQANLTDLIIWSSRNNKNKFILETHSEHMILRLKRRLRENFEKEGQGDLEVETLTNDVTINVITTNKNERKSQNKLLKITPSGNFNGDWPEGFFEERFVELGID